MAIELPHSNERVREPETKIETLKLVSGEDVLARVEDAGDHLVLHTPAMVVPGPNGGLAIVPWPAMCEKGTKIKVDKKHVIYHGNAVSDAHNAYIQFSTGLVTASNKVLKG